MKQERIPVGPDARDFIPYVGVGYNAVRTAKIEVENFRRGLSPSLCSIRENAYETVFLAFQTVCLAPLVYGLSKLVQ